MVEIQNIMCTVDLGCPLDLLKIANNSYNVEYEPKKFNPVVMRLREPKSTALIFSSGKIVCTGTKNEESARISARRFARIIQKLGFPVKFLNFRITNIAASSQLNFRPHIENIRMAKKEYIGSDSELFPSGLVYRGDLTFILFKTGKVIITNGKTSQQVYQGYAVFEKSINREPFRCVS